MTSNAERLLEHVKWLVSQEREWSSNGAAGVAFSVHRNPQGELYLHEVHGYLPDMASFGSLPDALMQPKIQNLIRRTMPRDELLGVMHRCEAWQVMTGPEELLEWERGGRGKVVDRPDKQEIRQYTGLMADRTTMQARLVRETGNVDGGTLSPENKFYPHLAKTNAFIALRRTLRALQFILKSRT